jgi:hypothetical protein
MAQMEVAYRVRLVNRFDGVHCSDKETDLGLAWFAPFTVEKLREAATVMGYTPTNDEVNDCVYEDLEIGVVCIEPTYAGAMEAWIDFVR